jgi:RNA polymerase sigma-70 factor, ECF subfamily
MAEFVERFQGQVFGLCWRMLRHRHDAEDAAQETLLRALRHLKRWDRTRPFEPWLLAIAANRCRTHLGKRRGTVQGMEWAEEIGEENSLQNEAAEQMREELSLALGDIRPHWANAFRLFHEREHSYIEIAEKLSIPVGTAKTWVHRARREIVARFMRREVIFEDRHAVRII